MSATCYESETFMKIIVLTLISALALASATGCNTVRGIGQDIEKGGEAIQRATK